MNEEIIFFMNACIGLFVIVDPFAVIPIYLMLTDRFDAKAKKATRRKASLIAFCILVVFAISGLSLFKLFGITLPAFQIAGGILLLLLGLAQLNASDKKMKNEETAEGLEREDISIFPLAMPLIAGPGSISTVVLYASEAHDWMRKLNILLVIAVVMLLSDATLKSAPLLFRFLGRTGLNILTRIMGIILTAIAIQFIINGTHGAYKHILTGS